LLGSAWEVEGKLDEARATLGETFSADSKSVAILKDLSRLAAIWLKPKQAEN
jgi:hypothetical protein